MLRVAIVLLALGGLGGSLQPSRIVLMAIGAPSLAMLMAPRWSFSARVEAGAMLMGLSLLLLGALSLIWSPAKGDGAGLWAAVAVGLLALPIAFMCKTDWASARQLRDAWSWAIALTIPLALFELVTGEHFAYALEERNLGGDFGATPFASAFFGNYNNYCTFICLALPMMLGTFESSLGRTSRWFWGCCIALTYCILAINTNRLSLIFSVLLLIYYLVTRKSWRWPFVFLALAVGTVEWLGYFSEEINAILQLAALKFDAIGAGDESVDERAAIIVAGLQQLQDSFGMGFGVGSFEYHLRLDHPGLIPNAHNLVIELATNFGGIAALGFLLFLAQLFVEAWRGILPPDLRAIPLMTLPFVPAIGAINSQAVGYTYWWLWLATIYVIVASGEKHTTTEARPRSPHITRLARPGAVVTRSTQDDKKGETN